MLVVFSLEILPGRLAGFMQFHAKNDPSHAPLENATITASFFRAIMKQCAEKCYMGLYDSDNNNNKNSKWKFMWGPMAIVFPLSSGAGVATNLNFLTPIILLKIKDVRIPPTRHHALPDRNWNGNHFGSRSRYHCVKI